MTWYARRPIAPKLVTWANVLSEARTGGYHIITTEGLAEQYSKDPSVMMIVDTRQEWEYRTGHIEGALNFPMESTRWARWRKADDLKGLLGSNLDRSVVFY
ncbi:MAG: rhodanese-like domain-containing protein [Proteobacteria bacterium]|nr:rhodanese-like domain-containing protein [Pseudomonadota bacterium]MBU4469372.1 rhodanese-like domain-containing protein [Pseudomonadota bacterium]